MQFAELGLNSQILRALDEAGYTTPTPIQEQAIPRLLNGGDIMASAQTGSGKTAAFMLPALERLSTPAPQRVKGPRILVLTPTRELALQVTEAAAKYGKYLRRVKAISILGGMSYTVQNRLLSQPYEILVATPGRLIDHLQSRRIDLSGVEMLILDEADRMLDMGFIDDVSLIAGQTPATRQTLLFSATLDGKIADLAADLLREPERIQLAAPKQQHTHIDQKLHYVDDLDHKTRLLSHLLVDAQVGQAIVFTATKRDADDLADELYAQGMPAASLHGDMSQRERNRTLLKLRKGGIKVLVATDVAARGIDVAGITHVFNYDLPKFAEDYVHRIGRTGRGGASGTAISFASGRDILHLRRIERFTGQSIALFEVEGFEAKYKPRPPRSGGNGERRGHGGGQGGGRRGFGDRREGGGFGGNRGRSSGFGDRREGSGGNRFERNTEGNNRFEEGRNHFHSDNRTSGEHGHGFQGQGDRFGRSERQPRFGDDKFGNRQHRHHDGQTLKQPARHSENRGHAPRRSRLVD